MSPIYLNPNYPYMFIELMNTFQTNHQVELLTRDRDQLMRKKEDEIRENRMREKEHYTNTLAKLRSEGLCR